MGMGMALVAAFTMMTTRVALPVAAGWLTAAILFSLVSYRAFARLPLGDPRLPGIAEFRICNRHAAAAALLWISPFWLQGASPGLDHSLAMWAIALLMMLTLAMVVHSVPSACLLFIAPVSLSAALALVRGGAPQLAGVALVAGLLLCAFCLRFAQNYIRFRRAEEVLHEKNETVSLLLREFEETSADWLWQTDNARRLIHVSPRLAYALGASADALEGIALLQALSGDAWETGQFPKVLHDMAERMKRRESFSNLIVPLTTHGTPRWWELSASPRLVAARLCARSVRRRARGDCAASGAIGRCLGNGPVSQSPARHGRTDEAARELFEPDRSGDDRRQAALVGIVGLAPARRPGQISGLSRRRIGRHRTARLGRADRPHGALRQSHRPAQPAPPHRGSRPRARPCRQGEDALRASDPRTRPLQGGQRHAGPPGRRQAARAGDRKSTRLNSSN